MKESYIKLRMVTELILLLCAVTTPQAGECQRLFNINLASSTFSSSYINCTIHFRIAESVEQTTFGLGGYFWLSIVNQVVSLVVKSGLGVTFSLVQLPICVKL